MNTACVCAGPIETGHVRGLFEMDTRRPRVTYRDTSDKNTQARESVGRCFLNSRKVRAKPVGLRFLRLRKCTKAVGPRFIKIKKRHESGQSKSVRPVRANVLHEWGGSIFPISRRKRCRAIFRWFDATEGGRGLLATERVGSLLGRAHGGGAGRQMYLAHKKQSPLRTLQ